MHPEEGALRSRPDNGAAFWSRSAPVYRTSWCVVRYSNSSPAETTKRISFVISMRSNALLCFSLSIQRSIPDNIFVFGDGQHATARAAYLVDGALAAHGVDTTGAIVGLDL